MSQPRTTPRNVGRFAAELLSGPTIIERLRFDFPLVGADESLGVRRNYNSPPRFETHTVVVQQILMPDTPRASRARLVDRATGREMLIQWPPVAEVDAGIGDGGLVPLVPDAGADARAAAAGDASVDARGE